MTTCPYGFRVVGPTWQARRLVDAAAFAAHAACDDRAELRRECYLSAFQFGDEFARHLETTGSTAGFAGACWSPWIWFDVDRAELSAALTDARRLAATLDERYRLSDSELLVFLSGGKGFHVGLPTSLWSPAPSDSFHRIARYFADQVAAAAGASARGRFRDSSPPLLRRPSRRGRRGGN